MRAANAEERRGNVDAATAWCRIGSSVASLFGHERLYSPDLEDVISRIGRAACGGRTEAAPASRRRWLHVFSQTYPIGGHTAIARRWIEQVRDGTRHSVALTEQLPDAADPGLLDAVRRNGGVVQSVAQAATPIARARLLRGLAGEVADVVVLHTHPADVVAALAFAAPGGPPVLLMNHQDHAFWVGVQSSDQIVDIRDSGAHLTRRHRGPKSHAMLPVPLVDGGFVPRDRSQAACIAGPLVREAQCVLLTIGSPHKYLPSPRFDFLAALRRLAVARPRDVTLAVGPRPDDPAWQRLHADTGGRVIALGLQRDLGAWHAAADVYVEGFPIGSYTALLEIALAGRPYVRKPLLAAPQVLPVDQGALADIDPPRDADEWVARAIELAEQRERWVELGRAGREAVLAIHCGEAWQHRLEALVRQIPAEHAPGPGATTEPVDDEWRSYCASALVMRNSDNPFGWAFREAFRAKLRPRVDLALAGALRRAREQACDVTSPVVALPASWALSTLPRRLAARIYGTLP